MFYDSGSPNCLLFHSLHMPCLMLERILPGEGRITAIEMVALCFEVPVMLAGCSNTVA